MSINFPIPELFFFKRWPWKSMVKAMHVVKGQGHIVGSPTNPITYFLFHIVQPCHSWNTAIQKFHLENPRSRSWPMWLHGHIWGVQSVSVGFSFCGNQTIFGKFNIWPWKLKVKVMTKVKSDGHIWGLEFNRYVCFQFCGNRTIFGWYRKFIIFDPDHFWSEI